MYFPETKGVESEYLYDHHQQQQQQQREKEESSETHCREIASKAAGKAKFLDASDQDTVSLSESRDCNNYNDYSVQMLGSSLSVYQKLDTKTAACLGFVNFSLHMKSEAVTNQPSTQVCAEPISSWSAGERWAMRVMADVQHVLFWFVLGFCSEWSSHVLHDVLSVHYSDIKYLPRFDYSTKNQIWSQCVVGSKYPLQPVHLLGVPSFKTFSCSMAAPVGISTGFRTNSHPLQRLCSFATKNSSAKSMYFRSCFKFHSKYKLRWYPNSESSTPESLRNPGTPEALDWLRSKMI